MSIEILKEGSKEKIAEWERKHDKRKTYRCKRCGCEWKCEWKDNKFGSVHDYNGDPDILCPDPECNSNDTEELTTAKNYENKCTDCKWHNGWNPNKECCDLGHKGHYQTCGSFQWRGYL